MGFELGTVINKDQVLVKISGPVAASTNLGIGWVYEDAGNGFKNAPTDGSIPAKRLWWNDKVRDNSAGVKGAKQGTFYGDGALVIGKAEGAIVVDNQIKTSASLAQSSASLTIRTDTLANNAADRAQIAGFYRGHVLQIGENNVSRTDAADTETNCVFEVMREA